MGKVLVLYDSASGNTEKMAGLVAEGAGTIAGTHLRLRKVEEASADDVLWCDGLALGSPTNMTVQGHMAEPPIRRDSQCGWREVERR